MRTRASALRTRRQIVALARPLTFGRLGAVLDGVGAYRAPKGINAYQLGVSWQAGKKIVIIDLDERGEGQQAL